MSIISKRTNFNPYRMVSLGEKRLTEDSNVDMFTGTITQPGNLRTRPLAYSGCNELSVLELNSFRPQQRQCALGDLFRLRQKSGLPPNPSRGSSFDWAEWFKAEFMTK